MVTPEEEKKIKEEEEAKAGNIIPFSTSVMTQAEKYCTMMHLPLEAVSSVLRALDNHQKLTRIIRLQQALPVDKRKKLLDTRSPLADEPMKMIDDFVEMHMIPYTSMTWIEGKPYPKADGIRYKLQADPRVVKKVTTTRVEAPKLIDENNMMIGYDCVVEFWNGEVYYATGWADLAELQTRRSKSAVSPGFMAMIAETRSKRRCTLAALGLPTGVAEEVSEGQEFEQASAAEAKTAPTAAVQPVLSVPTNIAQLLAMAYSEFHYTAQDIASRIGKPLSQITDFTAVWNGLKSSYTSK